jgi:hypothetical protein
MTTTSVYRIYSGFFLLYALDITLHNYSKYSTLGGLLAFVVIFVTIFLRLKSIPKLISTYLVPTIFLLLALFVARSTMTVAFFYFSLNIGIAQSLKIPLTSLFKPTLIFIYLFAGLNELSPGFRSGSILEYYLPSSLKDYSQYLSIGAIIIELLIALLIYFNWSRVIYLVLLLHLMIQILIPTDLLHFFSKFIQINYLAVCGLS